MLNFIPYIFLFVAVVSLVLGHYWERILDWSVDTIETCFEVKSMLFKGERFPFWLDCRGRVACFVMDVDSYIMRLGKFLDGIRVYYKHHQKARTVYDSKRTFFRRRHAYYQLWFRRWWTVPYFVYRFYCWQRVERSHRAAKRLQAERRW